MAVFFFQSLPSTRGNWEGLKAIQDVPRRTQIIADSDFSEMLKLFYQCVDTPAGPMTCCGESGSLLSKCAVSRTKHVCNTRVVASQYGTSRSIYRLVEEGLTSLHKAYPLGLSSARSHISWLQAGKSLAYLRRKAVSLFRTLSFYI